MKQVNCLVVDDEELARTLLENYISRIPHLNLVEKCTNPLEALKVFQEKAIDILFLDIQMPELTGIDFLKSLPLQKEVDGFTIVHATPLEPDEWNYIISLGDAAKNFPEFKGQICFIGHSHVPMVVSVDEERNYRVLMDNPLKIENSVRYIINVGSVGQPRDSNPKASFAILGANHDTQLADVALPMQRGTMQRGISHHHTVDPREQSGNQSPTDIGQQCVDFGLPGQIPTQEEQVMTWQLPGESQHLIALLAREWGELDRNVAVL